MVGLHAAVAELELVAACAELRSPSQAVVAAFALLGGGLQLFVACEKQV